MKVFATTAIQETMPHVSTYLPTLARLAEQDRFGVHQLADDPDEADIILFLDGHQHPSDLGMDSIRRHPLVRRHREKTFLYSEQDQPWCAMPGLYVCMPKSSFNPRRQRACAYIAMLNPPSTPSPLETGDDALLFSFMGRGGHRVRDRIQELAHPRAYLADTSAVDFFGDKTDQVDKQKERYAEVMRRSKFVLCPRGNGTSSFRLFETMAAGRVPVILSDEWEPPAGPAWESSSVRVAEADVSRLPALLEACEDRCAEMAAEARRQWEQWFAPDVLFHRMIEGCRDLLGIKPLPSKLLNRRYLYLWARSMKWKIKSYTSAC